VTHLSIMRDRIRVAAERRDRDPSAVTLIVVTKTVEPERIRAAVQEGATDLGENRVQEALEKQDRLADLPVRWHLIGHVQTNKAARAAAAFASVQSVDSGRIAHALGARRPPGRPALPVLVEVELTGQAARTGAPLASVDVIADAVMAEPALVLRGLMTVAPQAAGHPTGDVARPAFVRLRSLRDELEQRLGVPLPDLSMGMSDDFEVAVEEGATIVRLGRAVFGARPTPVGR
jgi:pyridoxal phosphate enzyme (YggS family)